MTTTLPIMPHLVEANRLAIACRLADDLAHDVRNPLNAMVINLELTRRRLAGGDVAGALERVQYVEVDVSKIAGLLGPFFDLFGSPAPAAGALGGLGLDTRLKWLLPLLRAPTRATRVSLAVDLAAGATTIDVRPEIFDQIVLNLLLAALDRLDRTVESHIALRSLSVADAPRLEIEAWPAADGGDRPDLSIVRALVAYAGGRFDPESRNAGTHRLRYRVSFLRAADA